MQVTRDNHFVPQAYLNRWADASGDVWRYQLLVSHSRVPSWTKASVRGIGRRRDLYTTTAADQAEADEFERWVEREYETPAQDAIQRAIGGDRLARTDWERLVLYCLIQDLRTPQSYREMTALFANRFNEVIGDTLERAKRALEQGTLSTHQKSAPSGALESLQQAIRVTVNPDAHPERDEGEIAVSALAGRRFWLGEVKRLIAGPVRQAALGNKWSIAEPADGMTWFTSDHPVVRLNYYGEDGKYDLHGGWARKRGNILMPLSPRHLLFTEVGANLPRRFSFSPEQTKLLLRVLAERADSELYANQPRKDVAQYRRRVIDADAYAAREAAWTTWHDDQNTAERHFDAGEADLHRTSEST